MGSKALWWGLAFSLAVHLGGVVWVWMDWPGPDAERSLEEPDDRVWVELIDVKDVVEAPVDATQALSQAPAATVNQGAVETAEPTEETGLSDEIKFMTDPAKAQLFRGYFAALRDKIHAELKRRYLKEESGSGTVNVYFSVDASGGVLRVSSAGKTQGSGPLGDFAKECIRSAGPYGPIPAALGVQKLSFTIKVAME